MLQSLHIENIALIKQLDIEFPESFSCFTGVTGAGKSILIDSISLLCGEKASKELIRNGETSAKVEGIFSDISVSSLEKCKEFDIIPDDDGIIYVSRTVTTEGKNSVKINSKPCPLSLLREISPFLINIHGQHTSQELLIKEKHKSILDSFAENENLLQDYKAQFSKYISLKKEYDSINTDETQNAREIEILKFQINDISSLKLKLGEDQTLESERKRLSNIEKISTSAKIVYESLYGESSGISALDSVNCALDSLKNLSKYADNIDNLVDKLENIKSEIIDIAETVNDLTGDSGENPSVTLDRIQTRLDDIAKAKKKYGGDIESVLKFLDDAKQKLNLLENSSSIKEEILEKLKICATKVKQSAKILHDSRVDAATKLSKLIEDEFIYLDMPKVKFKVEIKEKPFSNDGSDDIEFFIQTNAGDGFYPLCKIASGGEMSRIMLAIKCVTAEKDGIDTMIFDEIDTGISGKTSRKIGQKLLQISKDRQVLCVTHSAQIASLSTSHFLVSKSEDDDGFTNTSVKQLSDNERIEETARIIAGINITDAARKAAIELMSK